MRIVSLDFETANASMASACSLGIVIFEDGEFVDSIEWYFRPHSRVNYFTNTPIHGITYDDVKNEEEFVYYYERLAKILKNTVVVAHNAAFDVTVLNSVCDLYGLDRLEFEFVDTVAISRKVYPEVCNHKLNTMCDYLGIELNHHNAMSDSMACLLLLLKCMETMNEFDIYQFMKNISIRIKKNS